MADKRNDNDGLDDEWRDRLVSIGKGVAGAIPLGGSVLAEIVGMVIPGQRADRIATYLRALNLRVSQLSDDLREQIAGNAVKIDLIEEGGFQSARAVSPGRIDQIVEAVSRGLNESSADIIRRKRLLVLFGELDDDEIALLNAYGRSYAGADRLAFERVNRPPRPHLSSPTSDHENNSLYEAGRDHLIRMGLLRKNYGNVRKGQMPEFDTKVGDYKHSLEISLLGRMLLSEIGLETPFDAQRRDQVS